MTTPAQSAPSDVPIGTVIAYVGTADTLPGLEGRGWLLCDGRQISNSEEYQALWNTIGTAFGGSGYPYFYLPDLRGMFLRGVAADTDQDPDREERQQQNAGGNTGKTKDTVGSRQADVFESHTHNITAKDLRGDNSGWGMRYGSDVHVWGSALDNTGGKETRPKNVYVYYLIKAK